MARNLNRAEVGKIGEAIAARLFQEAGYTAYKPAADHCGDLHAVAPDGTLHRIEVKTATRGRDKKWRFTLVKDGCTDHRHSDYVLLIAANEISITTFLVPVAALAHQRQAVITSNPATYAGKLAQYRTNFYTL